MEHTENKMGVKPIKPLLITMSLPMMVSMLVQALYNVVDSIFVSRVGEEALTAVTLAFPLQNLMIALGSGTGVGVNALLSRSLGEKAFDRSDASANTSILLTVCNYIVFLLIGVFGVSPFLASQLRNAPTSDPAALALIQSYGNDYLRIICCFSIGVFMQINSERLLQATGRTFYSMLSQITGALINILLDPILIFGYFGLPAMGVAGAAWATVIGQCIGAAIALTLNLKKNPDIHLSVPQILKPRADIVKEIYFVGIPSILMMSIGSVMTYAFNLILMVFSTTAATVFGIYFKLQSFFFMPIFGLNNGLVPIVSYNYGARKKERITEALRFALLLAVCIMSIGTITFLAIPDTLLLMFKASPDMLGIGRTALRIISIHFPVAAVCIILGSTFQAFSKSYYSLVISCCRQLVVLIPAAYLLSLTGVVANVWWAFPIAEIFSLILSLIFFFKIRRDVIQNL